MIVTVTSNPAVDLTLWVDRLSPGTVHRSRESQVDAAGKGVNVSRMIARLGGATIALGFLGGETGRIVEDQLDAEHVQHHFIRVPGRTRVNATIVDRSSGVATSVFDRGPVVPVEALEGLEKTLRTWLRAARVVVIGGTLPPGAPPSLYGHWVELAREAGAETIVDAEGEPLAHALASRPTLIKPNRHEAEEILGRTISGPDAEAAAAVELAQDGTAVALSLGPRGAILARGGEAWRVTPPRVALRSTVGSGDSLVAGIALTLALGGDLLEGMRLGSGAGAATAAAPGTSLGEPDEVRRLAAAVRIDPIERPAFSAPLDSPA